MTVNTSSNIDLGKLLKWARNELDYAEEEVIDKIKLKRVTEDVLISWEAGSSSPSYSQLKKLAKIYRRPIALFFFPDPPEEDISSQQFRNIPSQIVNSVPAKIRLLVRDAKIKQIELEELNNTQNIELFPLKDLQLQSPIILAQEMRKLLNISTTVQAGWRDHSQAFNEWRLAIERLGIWVFKDSFQEKDYCGFCLYDKKFPIIYINNNQAFQRQIFTLFHELGHLLKGGDGIDFRIAPQYTGEYEEEEVFCNAFAGEFLVPNEELAQENLSVISVSDVRKLAKRYHVSLEVIYRKLLDKGLLSQEQYNQKKLEYEFEGTVKKKSKGSGGNYYATQSAYLGSKFSNLAFENFYKKRISKEELSRYLKVKIANLDNFEAQLGDI